MGKLFPQTKLNNELNRPCSIESIDAASIEKTLSVLIKTIENLEDKIEDIEYRLKNHVNTFNDIAHKI